MTLPQVACKLLTVICEASLENDLLRDLDALGATGCTVTDARGRGARGVRNAAFSESANIRIEVLCAEPIAAAIVQHLAERYYDNYAMVLFMSEVAVLREDKF